MEEFFSKKYGDRVKLGVMQPQADQALTAEDGTEGKDAPLDLKFDYLPRDIKKYLDRFVIRQDSAKKVLATAICDHYNHIKRCSGKGPCREYSKQNIVMLGPTGVGKTYLVRTIANLIGVPFVKADATKFSETGYVGGDVEDLVRELLQKADGNEKLAEYGIIYLDEVDKIASASNFLGRDVSGSGVQRGLLKLMEETEVPQRTPFDLTSQLQAAMEFQSKGKVTRSVINTRHILFIVSGAFSALAEIVRKRVGGKNIGFAAGVGTSPREEDYLSLAKSTDFIEYGFESEFIGRLPVVVTCQELDVDDLFSILKHSEGSIVRQYVQAFDAYGIELEFTDEGLRRLAELAYLEKTGARSLVGVFERTFRDFKFHLPDSGARRLRVTAELVDSPESALAASLSTARDDRLVEMQQAVGRMTDDWSRRNGIEMVFHPDAARRLALSALENDESLEAAFQRTFKNYEHGLSLIQKTRGINRFEITPAVIDDPAGTLDRWIRDFYIVQSGVPYEGGKQ
jgi:ATP-dependent Clp protease ATP-binding subunit ClpX